MQQKTTYLVSLFRAPRSTPVIAVFVVGVALLKNQRKKMIIKFTDVGNFLEFNVLFCKYTEYRKSNKKFDLMCKKGASLRKFFLVISLFVLEIALLYLSLKPAPFI